MRFAILAVTLIAVAACDSGAAGLVEVPEPEPEPTIYEQVAGRYVMPAPASGLDSAWIELADEGSYQEEVYKTDRDGEVMMLTDEGAYRVEEHPTGTLLHLGLPNPRKVPTWNAYYPGEISADTLTYIPRGIVSSDPDQWFLDFHR